MTDHQKELLTTVSVASTDADRKCLRKAEYPEVENMLVTYLERRHFLYEQDKCGLSWLILQVLYRIAFYNITNGHKSTDISSPTAVNRTGLQKWR